MSSNLYRRLRALLPEPTLQYGVIQSTTATGVTVELPDGTLEHLRGEGTVGAAVFFRAGAVEGPAPLLSVVSIEI
ncbi:MAG: hypothetical protein AB7E55_34255 [Pigmentiphaga sp.]